MRFDDANSASCVSVVSDARYERFAALAIARAMEAVPACAYRGVVVELQPRDFRQTAAHFLRIATPVAWPTDGHDVD